MSTRQEVLISQLQAENERLRAALKRIASMAVIDRAVGGEVVAIAREALMVKCGTPHAAEMAAELVKNLNELLLPPPRRTNEPEVECGTPWAIAEDLKREGKL